uniref:Head Tail Connector Protein n=1 Tax=Siphoviridae sp. ctzVd36 TaxID=2826530 RepID=A0A8S5M835_9CAUD|nr:MAG TPA: Head Tail Connector Protein [Siphoviridae sp. ctzVd36]
MDFGEDTELTVLKQNLQMPTNANDEYLKVLLKQAASLMTREGIVDDDSFDYYMAKIDYAAFLFRKRASKDNTLAMPRSLRYELNNILLSQKGR